MTRTQRLTLIATILGSTVVFLDGTVVGVALPSISDDLGSGLAGQQWVVAAYLLAMVSLILVGGSMGDMYGRRRMFVGGLIGFALTSMLCAIAPSDEFLIVSRALQGVAGALLVPGSLALVAATFSGAARGKAVGTWTAFTGIATVIGPAGGGALVDGLSWRAIFWINIPLIAVTVWLTLRAVEESHDPDSVPGIDWLGIVLSALGLGGPVFALIEQPTYGWGSPVVLIPMLGGIACFVAFLVHEGRIAHPMLDLTLFRIRNFWVTNLVTLVVYAGLMGGFFFLGLFLQQTAGYSALDAGLATTPVSVIMFVLSPRFGKIASGTGPRLPMCLGPIVGGAGMVMLTGVGAGADYVSEVLPGVLVFGLGLSATVAPLTATVLDSVSEHHAGVASGVNNGVSRVAGLLAVAVLGAVVSATFTSKIDENLPSSERSAEVARSLSALEDRPLGAPDTTGIPPGDAATLTAATDDASETAFHLSVLIAGSLMIVGGVFAGIGVQNPQRKVERHAPRAAISGDCGHDHEGHQGAGAAHPEPSFAPASE